MTTEIPTGRPDGIPGQNGHAFFSTEKPLAAPQTIGSHFTEQALREAEEFVVTPELLAGRPRVGGFTTDGILTRDRDDAYDVEPDGSGLLLHVSLADTSIAVPPGGELDRVVAEKSFSRYFGEHGNDPMLPRVLSEDRLSLNEGELRPAVTLTIPLGRKLDLGEPVIRRTAFTSRHAMTYPEADEVLKGARHPERERILIAFALANRLAQARGGVYDFQNMREVSEEGRVRFMNWGEAYSSMMIIRELMIKANMTIADFAARNDVPILFRSHDAMDVPAYYSSSFNGHAGLGFDKDRPYAHTTSGNRRRADMITGSQVMDFVEGRPLGYSKEEIDQIAAQINASPRDFMNGEQKRAYTKAVMDSKVRAALNNGGNFDGLVPRRVVKVALNEGRAGDIRSWIFEGLERGAIRPRDIIPVLFSSTNEKSALGIIDELLVEHPTLCRELLEIFCREKQLPPPYFQREGVAYRDDGLHVSVVSLSLEEETVFSDPAYGEGRAVSRSVAAVSLISKLRRNPNFQRYLE
ncbi:MAG: RNB domain-containing ribonuclease [Candidatus Levybacteria bacterium]|nr:RNB domain-containing ribonuclease [Candidatus Levybacteria bacterium]